MKTIIVLLISVSMACTQTINEQIKSLEQLTPKERVVLMNHIKEQLIEMNQNERMNTIEKLRAKMNPSQKEERQNDSLDIDNEKSKNGDLNKGGNHKLDQPIKDRMEHRTGALDRPKDEHEHLTGIEGRPMPLPRDIQE